MTDTPRPPDPRGGAKNIDVYRLPSEALPVLEDEPAARQTPKDKPQHPTEEGSRNS